MKFGTWDVYASGLLAALPKNVLDIWGTATELMPTDVVMLVFRNDDGSFFWVNSDADPAIYN
jgi:hypothetical protein